MDNSNNHARIGRHEIPVIRFKLRAWLALEDIRNSILEAAKLGKRDEFVSSMYAYISAASSIPKEELEQCNWYEIAKAHIAFYMANLPDINLPFIKPSERKKPIEKEIWEYPGRSWYMWANIFAHAYGWDLEYIAELEVNDALALLQEIFVDQQLDKEWDWMLSENAYTYDEVAKKSKFNPLVRPEWMRPPTIMKEIKNVRIRKDELPVGLILRWDDDSNNKPQ